MLFNSLIFPVFLAAFLPLYFLTSGRARLWICLIASYLFYGWWDWRFLSLLVGSTLVAFLLGILLADTRSPGRKRALVVAAVAINLGCLGYFKYANFFTASLQAGLESLGFSPSIGLLDVILPVGISFYTFQSLSYTIDVSRGHLTPERSLLRFATYLAFFPQLVAGPILRASDFMPQLASDRKPDWSMAVSGINLVLLGFVYKVVMADSLAGPVDERFGNPLGHGWASLGLGVVFYAFQIYGDFCGYTAIAIGIGRILGFDLGRNFDRPYFSASFSEFWTRWHISLSSWLRDYLYIPLGGNRLGRLRTMFNLLATMLIGGLWHGAGWNFVLWGGLHGTYLILQRLAGGPWGRAVQVFRIPPAANRILLVLLTFSLTCLAWIPFRSVSIDDAWLIARRIATVEGTASVPGAFGVVKGLSIVLLIVLLEAMSFRVDLVAMIRRHPVLNIAYVIGCLLLLAIAGTYAGHAFIYFQF